MLLANFAILHNINIIVRVMVCLEKTEIINWVAGENRCLDVCSPSCHCSDYVNVLKMLNAVHAESVSQNGHCF